MANSRVLPSLIKIIFAFTAAIADKLSVRPLLTDKLSLRPLPTDKLSVRPPLADKLSAKGLLSDKLSVRRKQKTLFKVLLIYEGKKIKWHIQSTVSYQINASSLLIDFSRDFITIE